MYKITIIAVGELNESYWKDAQKEYLKRMVPYAKIDIKELQDESSRNVSDRARILQKEGERIVKAIPKNSPVLVLDIHGRKTGSEEFARMLENKGGNGEHLCFIIGGPLGLSDESLAKASASVSLSFLTFTHQLARIVVLEQIYRAMTILHGKHYHY